MLISVRLIHVSRKDLCIIDTHIYYYFHCLLLFTVAVLYFFVWILKIRGKRDGVVRKIVDHCQRGQKSKRDF